MVGKFESLIIQGSFTKYRQFLLKYETQGKIRVDQENRDFCRVFYVKRTLMRLESKFYKNALR